MTPGQLLAAIRRHPFVCALLVCLGVAGGLLAAALTPTTYTVSSLVHFGAAGAKDTIALAQGNNFVHDQMPTYRTLVGSSAVLQRTATTLGVTNDPGDLGRSVSASVPTDSTVLDIEAVGESPEQASARALTTEALTTEVARLEKQPGLAAVPVRTQVVSPATPAAAVENDRRFLFAAVGGVAGLVLLFGFAAIVAARDATRS